MSIHSQSLEASSALDALHSPPASESAGAAAASADVTARADNRHAVWLAVAASAAWFASGALTHWWPALDDWPHTAQWLAFKLIVGTIALAIGLSALWRDRERGLYRSRTQSKSAASAWSGGVRASGRFGASLDKALATTPWWIALAIGTALWEVFTAQLGWLPRPFFAPPQALVGVFFDDLPRLLSSVAHSGALLAEGYVLGAITGFAVGVSIGWSKAIGYWLHPVLRLIGPLPATAWLPLAFFFFPSSFSASVFLIALATGFPVAVLTWSGVAAVSASFYDVARTLGARPAFLIFKVAIPAALPSVFVGLFMGLGASFSVLIVAEMMGVKAGLGWYLQWAQGWAAYSNMYAALLVMALMCSGLISALFLVRDRLLGWQKGLLKW